MQQRNMHLYIKKICGKDVSKKELVSKKANP